MPKVQFSTAINAPKNKVWEILWNDDTYRKWTSAFCEGSYAVTDNWQQGTKVLFLAPGGQGMVSSVEVNKPNEYMSFKHLGEVKDGVEDVTSEKVKEWAGAEENYTLKEAGGVTTLSVDIDLPENEVVSFSKIFPKALEQVKVLSEEQ